MRKAVVYQIEYTTARTRRIMSKETKEEIDLTDITGSNSPPTLISITKARREISRQLL